MSTVRQVTDGMLAITKLAVATNSGWFDGYHITAEHDIIRISTPWEDEEETPQDLRRFLTDNGWHWDDECGMWATCV